MGGSQSKEEVEKEQKKTFDKMELIIKNICRATIIENRNYEIVQIGDTLKSIDFELDLSHSKFNRMVRIMLENYKTLNYKTDIALTASSSRAYKITKWTFFTVSKPRTVEENEGQ